MPDKNLIDPMQTAYDDIVTRLEGEERARAARYAQDKGPTWQVTLAKTYDRLHPEEVEAHSTSSAVAGALGDEALLGGGGSEYGPFVPNYNPAFSAAVGRDIEKSRGYGARRTNDTGRTTAYGNFQMQDAGLRDSKMKGDDGAWTGRWGVFTDDDFLANKNRAQDRAYDDYLGTMERYNRAAGNFRYVGKINERRRLDGKPMTITEAGIMAAAHRQGQEWVKDYMEWADRGGWRTADTPYPTTSRLLCDGKTCTPEQIEEKLRSVETWLRHFQNIPLRGE